MEKKKVLLAMSGGVDSSAAAVVLQKMGYDVVGATMLLSTNNIEGMPDSVKDAKKVCDKLGIEHYTLDYREDFNKNVIDNFLDEYKNGRTPNPCVVCNKYLKFGKFLDKAKELGIDYIATGHYAKIIYDEISKRYLLKHSKADKKDQTYVLYNMTQDVLSHTIFPLGDFEDKNQIRELAEEAGLETAHKKDSQEICFIPDNDYAKFIEERLGKFHGGNIVDASGNILGRHDGIIHYTVGQRKGLGISSKEPLFVVKIDVLNNIVIVGEEQHIFSNELVAYNMNYISIPRLEKEINCKAKIRYSAKEASCIIYPQDNDSVKVVFDVPQRAITPGQTVVFYDGDTILGGGTII